MKFQMTNLAAKMVTVQPKKHPHRLCEEALLFVSADEAISECRGCTFRDCSPSGEAAGFVAA